MRLNLYLLVRGILLGIVFVTQALAVDNAADILTARKLRWKETLSKWSYDFDVEKTGVSHSLYRFQGDCQLQLSFDPVDRQTLTIKLMRVGKEVAALKEQTYAVFCGLRDRFYVTDFSSISNGCTVVAIDSATGKQVWNRELTGLGPIEHSKYSNQVTMDLRSDEIGGMVLIVTGRESSGDYIEVVDADTGTVLANRVYPMSSVAGTPDD